MDDEAKKIARFVSVELARSPVGEKESLWESGLIDSLGLLRLVRYLESEFGLRVPEKDINLSVFRSIESIALYVGSKGKRKR